MGLHKAKELKLYSDSQPDVQRIDYHDLRYYKVDLIDKQVYYPSVTTILNVYPSEYITEWKAMVGLDQAKAVTSMALAKGSRVHYGAEVILNGGLVICNPMGHSFFTPEEVDALKEEYTQVFNMKNQLEYNEVLKIVNFLDHINATDIQSEQMLYSVVHEYAGTGDLLFHIEDAGEYQISGAEKVFLDAGWHLGDFKSGKNVSPTAKFQMSAYLVALEEMYKGLRIESAMVIHTNAKTKAGIEGLKAHVYPREECVGDLFEGFKTNQKMYLLTNPTPKPKTIEFPKQVKYDVTRTNKGDIFSD